MSSACKGVCVSLSSGERGWRAPTSVPTLEACRIIVA